MHTSKRTIVLLIVLHSVFLFALNALTETSAGTIRGIVLDVDGKPVARVKVVADPMDKKIRATAVRFVETDAQGKYEISGLQWGSYKVFAMKESDGYPNTMLAFYSAHKVLTVTLSPTTATAELVISLGPKAGVLVVSTLDANSKNPVDATLTLRRLDAPDLWMTTGVRSETRVLVPANVSISVEVSAEGLHPERPPGSPEQELVNLNSAQEQKMVVYLRRAENAAEAPRR